MSFCDEYFPDSEWHVNGGNKVRVVLTNQLIMYQKTFKDCCKTIRFVGSHHLAANLPKEIPFLIMTGESGTSHFPQGFVVFRSHQSTSRIPWNPWCIFTSYVSPIKNQRNSWISKEIAIFHRYVMGFEPTPQKLKAAMSIFVLPGKWRNPYHF